MSIIYEALKKLETPGRAAIFKKKRRAPGIRKRYKTNYFALLGIILLSVGFIFWFNRFSDRVLSRENLVRAIDPAKPVLSKRPAGSFSSGSYDRDRRPLTREDVARSFSRDMFRLQGILYTEDKPFAYINGRKVRVGDSIENAKVDKITIDGVDLVRGEENIRLVVEAGR